MTYACVAATEQRARCRHWAEDQKVKTFCSFHQKRWDDGMTVDIVGRPDAVEFKFNVNEKWASQLMTMGVELRQPDFQAKEQKHIEHAEKHEREAFRYRKDIADSGVPVFGKDGLVNVSVYELFRELIEAYEIVDIFLRPTKPGGNQHMKVLVIYFSHGEKRGNMEAIEEVLRFLASSRWGHCHVWANPPGSTGKIKNTVNTSHREPDKQPERVLRFNDGLFASEEVAS